MKTKQKKPAICHDCGCQEGELHQLGCGMEVCPFCGNQLISCACCYGKLRIDVSPGTWAFSNGLTEEQEEQWLAMLTEKGRIPYMQWPNLCAYCGKLWPDMFRVPDEEWKKYIQPNKRREMVCRECFDHIKGLIDAAEKRK
jgi:hypothetical protein